MEAVNGSRDGMDQRSSTQYPNFNQILSGNASDPYTLESFVDYLSQNHCIEVLDFLSDAKTYVEAYRASAPDICATKMTSDSRRLGKQWKSLMSTYVMRAAPDEINLPEYIRAALLDRANVMILPPSPDTLEPAIRYAHELLTESALLPFIQSIRSSGNLIPQNNGKNGSNPLSSSREARNNMHAVPGASSELNRRQLQISRPNESRVQEGQITEGLRGTRKRWCMPFARLRKSLWRCLAPKSIHNPS